MQYHQLLHALNENADAAYRQFNKRLLKNESINVIGVRVPMLRKIAKRLVGEIENVLAFPDEYYEVTFIKLTTVSYSDYQNFVKYIDRCVPLIDNWATCDCFVPKCVAANKDSFLAYINRYAHSDGEFYQRFALTTLLHFYVEEKYLLTIFETIKQVNLNFYYVHMAAAWLIAEVLVKHYNAGTEFLNESRNVGIIDKKTHNKAIAKANESFRLSDTQKKYLKELKR